MKLLKLATTPLKVLRTPLKFILDCILAVLWFWAVIMLAIFASGCTSMSVPQKISPNEQWLQRYQNQHPKQAKEEVLDSFVAYLSTKKD